MTKRTKCISLWQPYASFMAWGIKTYETRSWHPGNQLKPGETLLIHAAKRKPQAYEKRLFQSVLLKDVWKEHSIESLNDLPYGAIVCATRYIDAIPTNVLVHNIQGLERLLGNYQPDRFGWQLELLKVAETPLIAKGEQGIFWYEWNES